MKLWNKDGRLHRLPYNSVHSTQQKKRRSRLNRFFSSTQTRDINVLSQDNGSIDVDISMKTLCISNERAIFSKMMNGIGDVHLFSGEYELAKQSYESALRSNDAISKSNIIQMARSLHAMGILTSILGNFIPALGWLHEAKNTVLEQNSVLTREDMLEIAAIFEDTGFVYFYGLGDKMESSRFLSEALRIRKFYLKEKQDNNKVDQISVCDVIRLKYMIEIVEETKKSNYEYLFELSEKNVSLLGLKCPTVIFMLCRCGILRRTTYENVEDALRYFKEATKIMSAAKLSERHPCVKEVQLNILKLEDKTCDVTAALQLLSTRRFSL